MSEGSIEHKSPGDSANQPSSVDQKAEAELEQLFLIQLEKASSQGLQLPISFNPGQPPTEQLQPNVTPITTSIEQEGSVSTETPVKPSLKRKLEVDEPVQPLATVPEKHGDVMAIETEKEVKTQLKKLTAEDIKAMSDDKLKALDRADISHLTKQDLVSAKVPIGKRNILRPLFEPEHDKARADQETKRKKTTSNLDAFNSVKHKIRLADSYDRHCGGSSDADRNFTNFLSLKGYGCSDLIQTVISSSQVAAGEYCSFTTSTTKNQLFGMVIDLHKFFGNDLMRGTTLRAGVFAGDIEVFHVGPGS